MKCVLHGLLLLSCCAGLASADDAPKFALHEAALWIIEEGAMVANPQTSLQSALPGMSRRGVSATAWDDGGGVAIMLPANASIVQWQPTTADIPSRLIAPLTMMTFHGDIVGRLDIEVRVTRGTMYACWPPVVSWPNRVRWPDTASTMLVKHVEKRDLLTTLDEEAWVHVARNSDALYVMSGARAERFLAYDAELQMPSPVKVRFAAGQPQITNVSNYPLHDVLIAQATPQGLLVAWLDTLPANSAAEQLEFSPPLALDSSPDALRTMGELKRRLAKAGLTGQEIELYVDRYASRFFDDTAVIVAARLDDKAIDQLLQISVTPAPAELSRIHYVVTRVADPNLTIEVDRLIAQLGDRTYQVREQAQERLFEIGAIAFSALQHAVAHEDLEVVMRAERILLDQNQTPQANPVSVP